MKTILAFALLLMCIASQMPASVVAPEIGASTAAGSLTLLSGGLLVLRSRRK